MSFPYYYNFYSLKSLSWFHEIAPHGDWLHNAQKVTTGESLQLSFVKAKDANKPPHCQQLRLINILYTKNLDIYITALPGRKQIIEYQRE